MLRPLSIMASSRSPSAAAPATFPIHSEVPIVRHRAAFATWPASRCDLAQRSMRSPRRVTGKPHLRQTRPIVSCIVPPPSSAAIWRQRQPFAARKRSRRFFAPTSVVRIVRLLWPCRPHEAGPAVSHRALAQPERHRSRPLIFGAGLRWSRHLAPRCPATTDPQFVPAGSPSIALRPLPVRTGRELGRPQHRELGRPALHGPFESPYGFLGLQPWHHGDRLGDARRSEMGIPTRAR